MSPRRCFRFLSKRGSVGKQRVAIGRALEVVKAEASFGIVSNGSLKKVCFLIVELTEIIDPFDRVRNIIKRFKTDGRKTDIGKMLNVLLHDFIGKP